MKKIIILFIVFIFLFVSCLDANNFDDFITIFKQAVEAKDVETLKKLSGDKLTYNVDGFKGKWTKDNIFSQFDFELVERLLSYEYQIEFDKNDKQEVVYQYVYFPLYTNKKEKYTLAFNNAGNGWFFRGVFTFPKE